MTPTLTPGDLSARLLACPFCGGEAALYDWQTGEDEISWWAKCISCGATNGESLAESAPDRDFAIAAWNRRAALSALPAAGGEQSELRALAHDMGAFLNANRASLPSKVIQDSYALHNRLNALAWATTPQPSAIEEGFSITVTIKDGEWTGTLQEWRQRPRSVVYRGPAAVGAQGDGAKIADEIMWLVRHGATVDWRPNMAEVAEKIRRLAAPAAGKGVDDATLMEGWHGAVNDASEIVGNATDERIRKRGTAVLAWLQSHPPALTRQPVAGDGMALVPREPTEAMLAAAPPIKNACCPSAWETYAAMLAAAPAATPTDGGEGK